MVRAFVRDWEIQKIPESPSRKTSHIHLLRAVSVGAGISQEC